MNFQTYKATIAEWTRLYPPPVTRKQFNPVNVRSCCKRCGSSRKVSRHHKGNDFYFACLRPDLYARDYIQFLPHQVEKLCDNCHKLVHKNYRKMMEQVKIDLEVAFSPPPLIPTKEWCDYWMNEFRSWFDKWIQKPFRHRDRKRRRNARRKVRRR